LLHDKIEIMVQYDSDSEAWIETFSSRLLQEISELTKKCTSYIQNKKYWLSEFNGTLPEMKVATEINAVDTLQSGWRQEPIQTGTQLIQRLATSYQMDQSTILLSVYSLMLSQLTGSEDVMVLVSPSSDKQRKPVPVRLSPSWNISCHDYIHHVHQQIQETSARNYGLEILLQEMPEEQRPVFTMGFVSVANQSQFKLEDVIQSKIAECSSLQMILSVSEPDGLLSFSYDASRFSHAVIHELGNHLHSLLQTIDSREHLLLGEFGADEEAESLLEVDKVEAFNF
jgi:hypothetical protein